VDIAGYQGDETGIRHKGQNTPGIWRRLAMATNATGATGLIRQSARTEGGSPDKGPDHRRDLRLRVPARAATIHHLHMVSGLHEVQTRMADPPLKPRFCLA
jgi:hypothetical protein